VFNVKRNEDGKLWLNDNWTDPENHWNSDNKFVFSFRKYVLFPNHLLIGVFVANLFLIHIPAELAKARIKQLIASKSLAAK